MARLSYKGTGRRCQANIRNSQGVVTQCKESASKGSTYCLKHKHMRKGK